MSGLKFFMMWSLGLQSPYSSTTSTERQALYGHVRGKRNVVEIGVYHGVNTRKFKEYMDQDGHLFAVDPFFKGRFAIRSVRIIAHWEVSRSHGAAVRWLECLGKEAASEFRRLTHDLVDFIFIDGDHTYEGVRGDWEAWSDLVDIGGIAAFHDSAASPLAIASDCTGSVVYTREVVERDQRFRLRETVDSTKFFERVA